MDDDIPAASTAIRVARWFVTEAYRITDTGQLVAAAGEQLVAAGIPLYRLAYFQLTLHPEFAGKVYIWRRGRGVEGGDAPARRRPERISRQPAAAGVRAAARPCACASSRSSRRRRC